MANESGTSFFPIQKPEPGKAGAHKRTNECACMCFLLYVALMIAGAVTAFFFSDTKRLTHGVDYQGRLCGVDDSISDVPGKKISDLPYLYYCGSYAFTPGSDSQPTSPSQLNFHARACVASCPTNNSRRIMCLSRTVVNFSQPVLRVGILQSNRVDISQIVGLQPSYPSSAHESRLCVPTDPNLRAQLLGSPYGHLHGFGGAVVSLWKGWYVVLVTTLVSAILGIAFLVLLSRLAGPVILMSLITGTITFLVAAIFFLIGIFFSPEATGAYQNLNPIFMTYYGVHARATTFFLGLFLLLVSIAIAAVTRNSFPQKIDEVVGVIHVATDCIFSPAILKAHLPSLELIAFPFVKLIVMFITTLAMLYGLAVILSTGKLEYQGISMNGQLVKGLEINMGFTGKHNVVKAWFFDIGVKLYVFGMIWVILTIRAIGNFAVQHCVCSWYFEKCVHEDVKSNQMEIIQKALNGQASRVKDVQVQGIDQMRGPRDGFRVKVGPLATQEVVVIPMGKPQPNGKWDIERDVKRSEKLLRFGNCLEGVGVAIRYHLGSMALAGLILPLCAFPRLIGDAIRNYLGMPHQRTQYNQEDTSTAGTFKSMISFFGVALDHTIGGFCPTLYSDMIVQNTDFWTAAKDNHNFIHALGGPLALLHGATSVYETVAMIINAVICTAIALLWFELYAPFSDPASGQYIDNHVALTLFALLMAISIGGTYSSLFASVADTLLYVASWSRQHYSYEILKGCCPMALMALFGDSYMRQCGKDFPKLGPPPDFRLQNLRAFGGDPLAGKFLSTMAKNVQQTLLRGGGGAAYPAPQTPAEQSPLLSTTGR